MAKFLVIVESPAKAKVIHKYLGNKYKVEASMGHVRDLPKSRLGVDLDNNFEPSYVIMTNKKKTVTKLKKASKNMNCIYLATDPDREGEAICWHLEWILRQSFKGDIKRVTFNEITPAAVHEAFLHSHNIDLQLVNAQQARRILDRIVGYKLSPLLWKKVARGLSAGRVQSVALKLIMDRERQIRDFKPQEYWSIDAELEAQKERGMIFKARLDKIKGEKVELPKREDVDDILDELKVAEYKVLKIDKKTKRRKPQPPFITSKLQQEAFNKLRFPAQKTMRVAQRLYEGIDLGKTEGTVGLITYMRTDSVNISKGALHDVRKFIDEKFSKDYLSENPRVYKSRKRAQEAHEAIRPTSVFRDPEEIKKYLTDDEYKLYGLIWKRFVSSQMSDAVDEVQTIDIDASGKYMFRTSSTKNIFPGFSKVYIVTDLNENGEKDEKLNEKKYEIPHLAVGDLLNLIQLLPEQHFTKPPARFNDASLVKTLEELGIGRPSTYAPTIQTLLFRSYVERRSSALHPTEMGELVIDLLVNHFSYILDVKFTALMEEELDEVEEGKKDWTSVLHEFYNIFSPKLAEAQEKMKNIKRAVITTEHNCDICGKPMVVKWGRFGKFLACAGFPECKYTRSIPTGFRCPAPGCDGELVRRQSRNKRVFYGCSNYPKCSFTVNKLPHKKDKDSSDKESHSQ